MKSFLGTVEVEHCIEWATEDGEIRRTCVPETKEKSEDE